MLAEELSVSLDSATIAEAKDSIDAVIGPQFGADDALLARLGIGSLPAGSTAA